MGRYVVRRLLLAVPQLLIISFVLFLLMQSFGDPLSVLRGGQIPAREIATVRRQMGLDKPAVVQYVYWLAGNDWARVDADGDGVPDSYGTRKGILRGDWGTSQVTYRPALEMIGQRLPNTLILMLTVEILTVIVAVLVGVYSAVKRYSWFDNLATGAAFVGYSMPVFWLALMLMYIFAVSFKRWGLPHLPTIGMYDPAVGKTLSQVVSHMVLPVTTLSVISVASYVRFVRSSMIDALHEDYMRTARSKGLSERVVLIRHGLRNALLPLVTIVGLDIPFLLAGAVVTEGIFSWPGMGRLFIESTERSDYPVLMAILVIISVAVVVFQILTDITYSVLDPRIRLE